MLRSLVVTEVHLRWPQGRPPSKIIMTLGYANASVLHKRLHGSIAQDEKTAGPPGSFWRRGSRHLLVDVG